MNIKILEATARMRQCRIYMACRGATEFRRFEDEGC